ncbi:hypothetical protein H257_17399 [Aphanomyces astaci]|uniref:DDE Tnp4 domain-containing protein n=1 Tax=Aphanomyces astaci TaxID=112090 RepID=W4FET3_APHAT|nr:hypothetical protein H257_17399 [Aphanomyces astaci]ETV65980.1 hypothetical protein H257_17399 [Aphanomyces astaci]|eukprot:XP_009844499.1 hypothetical protein H257_17399 [Aphanomyces astaci]
MLCMYIGLPETSRGLKLLNIDTRLGHMQLKIGIFLCALSYVERTIIRDIRYNLNAVSDANALLDFRFDVMGVKRLGYLLGLPAVVTTQRYRASWDEAMCIMLGRLAFPTRFHTMIQTFGCSRAALCAILDQ